MNRDITEECISGTEPCLWGSVHVQRFQGLCQENRVLEEFAEVHAFKTTFFFHGILFSYQGLHWKGHPKNLHLQIY